MVAVRGVAVVVVVVAMVAVVLGVLGVLEASGEREKIGVEEGEPEVLERWVGGGSRVSVVEVEVGAVGMRGVVVGVVAVAIMFVF
jgi:hypothetical protein